MPCHHLCHLSLSLERTVTCYDLHFLYHHWSIFWNIAIMLLISLNYFLHKNCNTRVLVSHLQYLNWISKHFYVMIYLNLLQCKFVQYVKIFSQFYLVGFLASKNDTAMMKDVIHYGYEACKYPVARWIMYGADVISFFFMF